MAAGRAVRQRSEARVGDVSSRSPWVGGRGSKDAAGFLAGRCCGCSTYRRACGVLPRSMRRRRGVAARTKRRWGPRKNPTQRRAGVVGRRRGAEEESPEVVPGGRQPRGQLRARGVHVCCRRRAKNKKNQSRLLRGTSRQSPSAFGRSDAPSSAPAPASTRVRRPFLGLGRPAAAPPPAGETLPHAARGAGRFFAFGAQMPCASSPARRAHGRGLRRARLLSWPGAGAAVLHLAGGGRSSNDYGRAPSGGREPSSASWWWGCSSGSDYAAAGLAARLSRRCSSFRRRADDKRRRRLRARLVSASRLPCPLRTAGARRPRTARRGAKRFHSADELNMGYRPRRKSRGDETIRLRRARRCCAGLRRRPQPPEPSELGAKLPSQGSNGLANERRC